MSRMHFGLAVLFSALGSIGLAAEPFEIDLTIRVGKSSKTVHGESASPLARPKEREILEMKAGERINVSWKLSNSDEKSTIKDVTVHFYAAKTEDSGQASVKKLDKDVAAESALNMDFGPKEKNEGELNFVIEKPGLYLFRLETIGAAAGPAGHEMFAAIAVKAR